MTIAGQAAGGAGRAFGIFVPIEHCHHEYEGLPLAAVTVNICDRPIDAAVGLTNALLF